MNATRLSILGISVSILLGLSMAGPQQDDTSKKKTSSQSETIARPMTEKERKAKEKKQRDELATPYKKWLNEDVAYIITDEERAAFKKLNNDEERETFHRELLAAPRSHARHRRERVQGRALPPHRLRQRAFRLGHSRLEDRPRPHLHHLRPAGRNRRPLLGRLLRAASGRRRRRNLHVPVPAMALSLHRRHRQQHHHRIRRPHHVGRVPHD